MLIVDPATGAMYKIDPPQYSVALKAKSDDATCQHSDTQKVSFSTPTAVQPTQ